MLKKQSTKGQLFSFAISFFQNLKAVQSRIKELEAKTKKSSRDEADLVHLQTRQQHILASGKPVVVETSPAPVAVPVPAAAAAAASPVVAPGPSTVTVLGASGPPSAVPVTPLQHPRVIARLYQLHPRSYLYCSFCNIVLPVTVPSNSFLFRFRQPFPLPLA